MKIMKNEKMKEENDIRKVFWKMQEKITDELDKGQLIQKINVKIESPGKKINSDSKKKINNKKISPDKQRSVKDMIRKLESKS